MDRLPLLFPWYNPAIKYCHIELTVHTLNDDHFIKSKMIPTLKYKHNIIQPEMSYSKNCNALVLIRSEFDSLPMITIPCDVQYETSYVCMVGRISPLSQSIISAPSKSLETPNYTCDHGWFTMDVTGKCCSVMWTKSKLSYNDAQDICKSQNALVLTLDVRSVKLINTCTKQ